ncbi:MAG: flagellar hook-length control protein FliK [Hyphomicrobiaceae bacterium]|nr:flagellar hook-length control protein FliK [Hyphomicrobiaceae bacterium]
MTSLASYLASLAGAAPQEGQKATPANGAGASGVFATLLETTSAGDAATETPHSTDPTAILPTAPGTADAPDPTKFAAGDNALSEALTIGIDAEEGNGAVEAAILEEPSDADIEGALSGEPASPTHLGLSPDETDADTVIPSPERMQDKATAPAPHASAAQETAAAQNSGAGRPSERLLHRQAVRNQNAQDISGRPTGLDNAVQRASDDGHSHGLTTALERTGRGNGQNSQSGVPGDPATDPVDEIPAPGRDGKPLNEPGKGRADFAPQAPQIVQRFFKTGTGQNLIQVQERIGGETYSISSPPTLTVSVQAPAASPGPAIPPAPHAPVGALAVHIAHQANNGAKRFDIRLDPPELGRIEVRLDVSREGQVMTHLVVERAETLDLLLRDAKQLERALQDAGLDTSDKGMKFSLKDQGFTGEDGSFFDDEPDTHAGAGDSDDDSLAHTEMPPPKRYTASTGLDIRI